MKSSVDDIVEWIEDRHEPEHLDEMTPKEIVGETLQAVVDLELPELQEELERYEGKKFMTMGKIEFLNELQQRLEQ